MLSSTKDRPSTPEAFEDAPTPDSHVCQSDLAVDAYCDELHRAATGEHRAYHLSHVIDAIARRCAGPGKRSETPVLSNEQRDRLLVAFRAARAANPNMFWEDSEARRKVTAQGFKALLSLILLWSETEEKRAAHPEHFMRDALDRARIFQNLMHNVSLAEDIEARAWSRSKKAIEEIRLAAIGDAK